MLLLKLDRARLSIELRERIENVRKLKQLLETFFVLRLVNRFWRSLKKLSKCKFHGNLLFPWDLLTVINVENGEALLQKFNNLFEFVQSFKIIRNIFSLPSTKTFPLSQK
jgi:hypothetical protein